MSQNFCAFFRPGSNRCESALVSLYSLTTKTCIRAVGLVPRTSRVMRARGTRPIHKTILFNLSEYAFSWRHKMKAYENITLKFCRTGIYPFLGA